jgi:transposase
MITVETQEHIRRAYYLEHKSKRQIARELGVARDTVDQALGLAEGPRYTLKQPRTAPKLGPFKTLIDQLLAESEQMPRKQRYTGHTIFKRLKAEGYPGREPSIRGYIAQKRRELHRPEVFLPLAFDPGVDAQVDWGEAQATIAGERLTVQLFVMRLCYARRLFVRAFPTQKQESFFDGHVQALHYFGGVPRRLTYDNLSTAGLRVLEGRNRQEQEAFIVFRSHYLFESHFCTPGQGHEKGGVEHGVGYARRNFMVPIPDVDTFEALNAHLLAACREDDARRPNGMSLTIAEAFEVERPQLRPLPEHDFPCCATVSVTLNPYSQVTFETNRYSVPVEEARRTLALKAYPFRLDILDGEKLIATHPRCYARHQDLFDPYHYLPLLEQRPGAFEHAKPLRLWREKWPENYEKLLARLRAEQPDGQGVREFIRVLNLHRQYPAKLVEQAITQALTFGCIHLDGIQLCLNQLQPVERPSALDLRQQPRLSQVGQQPLNLHAYNELIGQDASLPLMSEVEGA